MGHGPSKNSNNSAQSAYEKLKTEKYKEHKAIFDGIDNIVGKYITAFKMYETLSPSNNARSVELMKEASTAKMREADGEVSKYKISLSKLHISEKDKGVFIKYLEGIRPYYDRLIRDGMRTVDKTRRAINAEKRTLTRKLTVAGVKPSAAANIASAAAAAAANAALDAYAGAGAPSPAPARAPVPGVRLTYGKRRGGSRSRRRSTRSQRSQRH